MEKILVCFDGSENSQKALNKAMSLMEQQGQLFLLAVVPDLNNKKFFEENFKNNMEKNARNMINEVISDIGEHGFSIHGLVKKGDPPSMILDTANDLDVDLILIGSKAHCKIGRFPIGGVANKVVQYAHKPVMVVR